jgi:uncharacterized membrane protein
MRDEQLNKLIGKLLRAGVAAAATVVLVGGIWYLVASDDVLVNYRQFRPSVRNIRGLGELPAPESVMLAGLLILIATPVARVVLSVVAFAAERDNKYVVCTTIVLLVLMYSIGTSWL